MNSDMYLRWVKNRLLPTFQELYPGKQMILIQDNVSKESSQRSAAAQHSTAQHSTARMDKRSIE